MKTVTENNKLIRHRVKTLIWSSDEITEQQVYMCLPDIPADAIQEAIQALIKRQNIKIVDKGIRGKANLALVLA